MRSPKKALKPSVARRNEHERLRSIAKAVAAGEITKSDAGREVSLQRSVSRARDEKKQQEEFCCCCNEKVKSCRFSDISEKYQKELFKNKLTVERKRWCKQCQQQASEQFKKHGVWTCHRTDPADFVYAPNKIAGVVEGQCALCGKHVRYEGTPLRVWSEYVRPAAKALGVSVANCIRCTRCNTRPGPQAPLILRNGAKVMRDPNARRTLEPEEIAGAAADFVVAVDTGAGSAAAETVEQDASGASAVAPPAMGNIEMLSTDAPALSNSSTSTTNDNINHFADMTLAPSSSSGAPHEAQRDPNAPHPDSFFSSPPPLARAAERSAYNGVAFPLFVNSDPVVATETGEVFDYDQVEDYNPFFKLFNIQQ